LTTLELLIEDLVAANRILARENVVDAYGHVSVRHPEHPDHFLLSRARTPQCIEASDIMEFTLDGTALDAQGRMPYLERFIHGSMYEARPEVRSVIHNHSHSVIPFGVGGEPIRPLLHNCACIGHSVPVWDSRETFGDTDLLVSNMTMGRELARFVGAQPTCLMRGHGSVVVGTSLRNAVYTAIALKANAELQLQARQFPTINFLSPGEIKKMNELSSRIDGLPLAGSDRAWEYWCYRAGVAYRPVA
jgi:ribulose-5-phosphate 4-epimerase/fuculose-1-phosphate aldolase